MEEKSKIERIRPQPGYQMKALSSKADIVIGGGAAGSGKTYSLLLDPLKHITTVPRFSAIIFRKNKVDIRNPGGLWDASANLYCKIKGAYARESILCWSFKCGNVYNDLKFSQLDTESDIYNYQGAELNFIGFDELTHFTEKQFFYLLTRNRSTCGIKPYVRCTCNPDPDSWVAEFISWWIGDDGYPIPERDGVVRYYSRNDNEIISGATIEEVYEMNQYNIDAQITASRGLVKKEDIIKSYTFIAGSIYDNKKLLEVNPQYIGGLMAQGEEDKRRLLLGNWKVSNDERNLIQHSAFEAMFYNTDLSTDRNKAICVDVALEGSNKMAVMFFEGKRLQDVEIIDRSNGNEVVEIIRAMQRKYSVPNFRVIYDADGVGGFIKGFIPGSIAFHGNGSVIECKNKVTGKNEKPNYQNLKNQLYFEMSFDINEGLYTISEHAATKMYDKNVTFKQRLRHEMKCLKRAADQEGKQRILSKKEMKEYLKAGESPDLWDTFVLHKHFDIKKTFEIYG